VNKNVGIALVVGGIIIAAPIIMPLVFGQIWGWQGCRIMGSGVMGGSGWGWFAPIFFILFWGLVIWGIVLLVRGLTEHGNSKSASGREDAALEILKNRYAKGDIGKEEYEEKKRDLI